MNGHDRSLQADNNNKENTMSKTKGLKDSYEYIVIGTGPGGGTVARELALGGKKVLMIGADERYGRVG